MADTELHDYLPALKKLISFGGQGIIYETEVNKPTSLEDISRITDQELDGDILISSFSLIWLKSIRKAFPKVKLGLIIKNADNGWIKACEEIDAYSIRFSKELTSNRLIEEAHRNRLKVFVGPVDSKGGAKLMRSMSVDGIFTTKYDEMLLFISRLS